MSNREQDQIDVAIKEIFESVKQYYHNNEESPNIRMDPRYVRIAREHAAALVKPLIDMKIYQAEHSLSKTILIDKNNKRVVLERARKQQNETN